VTVAARPRDPRRPIQERGQRRVGAILEAAAELVAADGVEGVTMHGLARRARTAIGSMYHFFPDIEAVFAALAERHRDGLRRVLEGLDAAGIDWASLSLGDAVDAFLDPLLGYLDEHPDVLHVTRRPGRGRRRNPQLEGLLTQIAERIVLARTPDATAGQRALRAATMLAILDGILTRVERTPSPASPPSPAPPAMMRELKRALVAYLRSYETGRPPAQRSTGPRE
jgi:AcrR family transcriptional regulator